MRQKTFSPLSKSCKTETRGTGNQSTGVEIRESRETKGGDSEAKKYFLRGPAHVLLLKEGEERKRYLVECVTRWELYPNALLISLQVLPYSIIYQSL